MTAPGPTTKTTGVWVGTTTVAPEYLAPCGHMHPWGVGCSASIGGSAFHPYDRKFGPCTKCDGTDLLVRYHTGKHHCADCRRERVQIEGCKNSAECGPKGRRGEHLTVHCRRCQHGWLEKIGSVTERPK